MLLICEGSKTERIYFKRYAQQVRDKHIRVPTCSETDPVSLISFAKKCHIRLGYSLEEIWIVFDIEESSHERQQMLNKAKKEIGSGINLVLSNPCFELWFLLHFEYLTDPLNKEVIIRKLDALDADGYRKNVDYYDILKPLETNAILNAEKLIASYNHCEEDVLFNVQNNPVCNVHQLIKEITS